MDHKCFQTLYKDAMLKDLPSVSLKCSICFQWQLLYSHSLYNHVSQAQNGSSAAVSVPTGLFTDYVIIWWLLIVPIRQGDVSRIAGLDLLHIKVITILCRWNITTKASLFISFFQTECKNSPEKDHLSKKLVYSSFTLHDLKESRPYILCTILSLRSILPVCNTSHRNVCFTVETGEMFPKQTIQTTFVCSVWMCFWWETWQNNNNNNNKKSAFIVMCTSSSRQIIDKILLDTKYPNIQNNNNNQVIIIQ